MQYEVKQRVNKVDSLQDYNLRIPELDLYLNQAHMIFIKETAMPRFFNNRGVDRNQRSIDDLRTLIIEKHPITPASFDVESYKVALPTDYLFHISSTAEIVKGDCTKKGDLFPVQHDDLHESNSLFTSSFEWGEINYRFFDGGIRMFAPDFQITKVYMDYIRKPALVHNAKDYIDGTYKLFGTPLSGSQDSELPEHTHPEIVDIAAKLIIEDLLSDPNLRINKIMNQN